MEHTFAHYFDLDILPDCKEEIFVDLGAYIGDTIQEFVHTYGEESYCKIYAYEMSEDSSNKLKENTTHFKNIIIRNVAISDTVGFGKIVQNMESASANVLENSASGNTIITTLDKDITEKVTMIKMDIEGSEQKAILGAKRHIQNEMPKLLLSVYHGFFDLVGIWKQVKEMNPNYTFYLRYYGGPIFPTEIVLYAI